MKKNNALGFAFGAAFVTLGILLAARAWAKPNTNIVVEANSNDILQGKDRVKEDSFNVPIDGNTSVGFTDDGNPGVFNRF